MKQSNLIMVTNEQRNKYKIGKDSHLDVAIDIDNGCISPCMGLPKKYWYEDCIILVIPNNLF